MVGVLLIHNHRVRDILQERTPHVAQTHQVALEVVHLRAVVVMGAVAAVLTAGAAVRRRAGAASEHSAKQNPK